MTVYIETGTMYWKVLFVQWSMCWKITKSFYYWQNNFTKFNQNTVYSSQALKIRCFITWLWEERTLFILPNIEEEKVSTFYLCRKNGSKSVSTISTYDRQKWNWQLLSWKVYFLYLSICTDSSVGKQISIRNVRKLIRYMLSQNCFQ